MQNLLISYIPCRTPTLRYWGDSQSPLSIELKPRSFISIKFYDSVHCVGWNDEHGEHRCPNSAVNTKQCPTCRSRDILRAYASADFAGLEHLKERINNVPTSLYLALFGDVVKCGITATSRVEARLAEQGADMYAELMRFPTREEARRMELLISSEFGITERVMLNEKIECISLSADETKLRDAIAQIREREPFSSFVMPSVSIKRIDYNLPEKASLSWKPSGEVLGAKGVFLFIKKDGENYFVPMHSFKGHLFDFTP
ncbi:MAG: DUF2797 domain-containing protein [Candidatus Anstonellales archaeon]